MGFIFLLGERAGSGAINPCPLAAAACAAEGRQGLAQAGQPLPGDKRGWGQPCTEEEGWGSGDVTKPPPGAGAAVDLEGRSEGLGSLHPADGVLQEEPPGRRPGLVQHPWGGHGLCPHPMPHQMVPLVGGSGRQKYPRGAGGRMQQRDSLIFNFAYISITLWTLFHIYELI